MNVHGITYIQYVSFVLELSVVCTTDSSRTWVFFYLLCAKRQHFKPDQIQGFSAEDEINVAQKRKFGYRRLENIVGKGENAGYQHFLLFPQCFLLGSLPGSLKVRIVWCYQLQKLIVDMSSHFMINQCGRGAWTQIFKKDSFQTNTYPGSFPFWSKHFYKIHSIIVTLSETLIIEFFGIHRVS